jgi:EAL domain-containing protein (putative c-di-GMP-specific phosphodiesterase class I)
VCRTLRHWHEDLGADWVQCSVNVSVRHLNKPDLVATVPDALAESGLPGHRLILEITESAVMESPAGTRETLHALEALGVRLALDDFGTGYSSLARLQEFPFDILKVDRSFIAQLGDDGERASVAGAIVSLSRALGLGTCAEGIEDEAQLRAVARLGATHAQGFHIGRPAPPSTFDDKLRAAQRPA